MKDFQTELGVKPTGAVDAATVAALEKAIAKARRSAASAASRIRHTLVLLEPADNQLIVRIDIGCRRASRRHATEDSGARFTTRRVAWNYPHASATLRLGRLTMTQMRRKCLRWTP